MWRCGCGDLEMWRYGGCVDVEMCRCGSVDMWRCGHVKMLRWRCVDEKMCK